MTAPEDKRSIVKRIFEEAWRPKQSDGTNAVFASTTDYMNEVECNIRDPVDGLRALFGVLTASMPDIEFSLRDALADGNLVVQEWSATGTHTKEALGVPPSSKRAEIAGTIWLTFDGDRVISWRPYFDEHAALFPVRIYHALLQSKAKRKLIPVCYSCQWIREESGRWKRGDEYIHRRWGIAATHCICPKCFDERFGELARRADETVRDEQCDDLVESRGSNA